MRMFFGILVLGLLGAMAWDYSKLTRIAPAPLAPELRADLFLIEKSQRTMVLFRDGKELKRFSVALGSSPLGHKQQEGDGKTPEGRYRIDFTHPKSAYHLALRISYPREEDRLAASQRGLSAGSDIMIHGLRNGFGVLGALHRVRDWTNGCIALTNEEIEDVWRHAAVGTPVEIRP